MMLRLMALYCAIARCHKWTRVIWDQHGRTVFCARCGKRRER